MYPDYEDDYDVESDEDSDDLDIRQLEAPMSSENQYYSQADKRAHHNALERKRRDHIKDSFNNLHNSVPALQGQKASRAQILKRSADYITVMKKKTNDARLYLSDLKRTNAVLESQLKALRNAKNNGTFPVEMLRNMTLESETESSSDSSEDESSSGYSDEDDEMMTQSQTKRIRTRY